MTVAIRSVFAAGVAFASAGVIAVSPLAPAPGLPVPTIEFPAIELTAAPALGAIPYQVLLNLLGDGLALAPILIGGIEQCTVCAGPVSPVASPFTGWGALGLGVGLLTSPFAIVGAVQAGQSITQALGVGLLAIQVPVNNTFALLAAPRVPFGGYEFDATRDRAAQAVIDAVVGTFGVAAQVLAGVRTVINGTLVGITTFAQTLATTGDFVAAFNAGLAPVSASVQTAVGDTVSAVQTLREAVYNDLTNGPGVATSPIPTVPAAGAAQAAPAAGAAQAAPAAGAAQAAPAQAGTLRGVAAARAHDAAGTANSAAVAAGGDESSRAETVSADTRQAAARPNRARSAEARSAEARSHGARSAAARAAD
jgi:hypothetical protein